MSHPLLSRFCETSAEPLLLFREAAATEAGGSPLVRAMLHLEEACHRLHPADEAQREAVEVSSLAGERKAGDESLFILFLATWGYFQMRRGRYDRAAELRRHAEALVGPSTEPEVRAAVRELDALLAGANGYNARREEIYREILSLLPPSSPRRKNAVFSFAIYLSRLGRALEIEPEIAGLRPSPEFPPSRAAFLRFLDACFTGRTADAWAALPEVECDAELVARLGNIYTFPRALLALMTPDPPPEGTDGEESPPWLDILRRLLERRPEAALGLARRTFSTEMVVCRTGFRSLNLIRAEIACRNEAAGRRLIELRRARGNCNYLDDFFLARCDLLAGDASSARARFAAVREAAERCRAKGRLEFEFRLSCEMGPADVFRLMEAVPAAPAPPPPTPPPPPAEPTGPSASDALIGRSAAMEAIRQTVRRVGPLPVPVLITGETGTGKEIVARALHAEMLRQGATADGQSAIRNPQSAPVPHFGQSAIRNPQSAPQSAFPVPHLGQSAIRNPKSAIEIPFLAVNCNALAESLLESELFGHEKGAFTGAVSARRGVFEEAGTGALFLDEIGDISPRLQTMLLRVLETGEVRPVGGAAARRARCRVIAATNAPLEERVEAGTFRRDLFFRLNRFAIRIPPLRERREDILPIACHYLDAGRAGGRATLSHALREALLRYDWPGNVREVRNEMERMRLVTSDRLTYDVADLEARIRVSLGMEPAPAAPRRGGGPRRAAAPVRAAAIVEEGRSPLRRLDRLRALFRQYGKLTRAEIVRILRVSPDTATRDLKELVREGFISKVRPRPAARTHYFEAAQTALP